MATNVIKESSVREIFKDKQVTSSAIKSIDVWVEKNLRDINNGLADKPRITDIDIDLYIETKLLNDTTWTTARDFLVSKLILNNVPETPKPE